MNTCIFLVFQFTLDESRGAALSIFKCSVGLLVHLFNSCQLPISYAKYVKLVFKVFDQGKSSGDMRGGGKMKKM